MSSLSIFSATTKRSTWLIYILFICLILVSISTGRRNEATTPSFTDVESELDKTADSAPKTADEAEKAKELLRNKEATEHLHEETTKPSMFSKVS